jgi:serine/threonine-protein kinase
VLLEAAQLVVADTIEVDGNIPAGRVLDIDPDSGTQLDVGSPVVLTVATGRTQVPDVRGQGQDEAAGALQEAGFTVAIELRDDAGEPGRVLDQDPVGALAGRGSTVRIVVSQTPPPPPPPSPSPSPSPEPTPEPTPTPSPTPTASPSPQPSPLPSPVP